MDFLDIILPILPMCLILILVLLLGVGVNYLWLKIMLRRIRACPECGAKAAGEVIDTEEIVISNKIERRGRKPFRTKETKIIDHFQCEKCSHTWKRSFIQKERIKIEETLPGNY